MIDIDKMEAMIRVRKEPQALAAIAWVCPHCQGNESSCECDQELFDALPELLVEVRRLRRIEDAAKEVAANEAEDIDSRLRYVSVQPGRDEWAALKAALCKPVE